MTSEKKNVSVFNLIYGGWIIKKVRDIARAIALETVAKVKLVKPEMANDPKTVDDLTNAYEKLILNAFHVFTEEMIADPKTQKLKPGVTQEFLARYTEFLSEKINNHREGS